MIASLLAAFALASSQPVEPPVIRIQRPEVPKNGRSTRPIPKNQPPPPPPAPPPQDYEPDPAIWLLADEDTTIYLFGTIHSLPPGFRWRSAAFERVVTDAEELIVETSDADAEAAMGSDAFAGLLMGATDGEATSKRLGGEAGEKWLKLAAMGDLPTEVVDRMPPFLALMGLGIGVTEAMGSDHASGVESVLEAEFARAGKPVGSIERFEDVFGKLLALDDEALIAELREELAAWDGESLDDFLVEAGEIGEASDAWTMEHDWARGRPEELRMEEMRETPFGETLYGVLLVDRNRAWAEWLDQRLDSPGTILVAVGAGHFAGPDSVQAMLEQRGLEAVRFVPGQLPE